MTKQKGGFRGVQATIRITTFLIVVIGSFLLVSTFIFQKQAAFTFEAATGKITISATDAKSEQPIQATKYSIIDQQTGEVVAEIMTDEFGVGTSEPLRYGYYTVRQSDAGPYRLLDKDHTLSLFQDVIELDVVLEVPAYVRSYKYSEEGHLQITSVYITVPPVMQLPELPHGCEITSATSVLNHYGYKVSKTTMADHYLLKEPFSVKNSQLYGPNPYKAYAGDPRKNPGGFFSYAPPIVKAVNQFIGEQEGSEKAFDISGSSQEEIFAQLNRGIPVVIWVTLDLSKPLLKYSWYITDTNQKFIAPINLHAVVLNGYDEKNVFVMNPLKGEMTYDIEKFFASYAELGSHALIIE